MMPLLTIKTHITVTAVVSRVSQALKNLYGRIHRNPKKSALAVALLILAIFFMGGTSKAPAPAAEESAPSVTLASVATLSNDQDELVLLGEVRSVSQAELRAKKPGEVTRVYVVAGDMVFPGTILAEINASAERAAVLSAQGSLAAAEAGLAKTEAGARTEDRITASAATVGATISLQSAEESARSAYSQAYTLAQDAVFASADDFFTKTTTINPSFRVSTASYDEKQTLEAERVALGGILEAWRTQTEATIPASELDAALVEAQSNLNRIKRFLNTISAFVSEQETPDMLSSEDKAVQEGTMLAARSSVDSARSAVTGARQALANAASAQVAASFGESAIVTGARKEDLAAAQAAVTQARGALASAAAALENALIRSPIKGTVTSLNVATGDFVSTLESVAVVANPGALEIETFVSAQALDRIAVGMPVIVGGTAEGTVTSVAPGLDPTTKKARVTVGVADDAGLVNGSFVELTIRSQVAKEVTTVPELSVPITAIKVLPRGLVVFTVSNEGTVVTNDIIEGPIVGSKMLVADGLTPDMLIVTDVRGLKEGDAVKIAR